MTTQSTVQRGRSRPEREAAGPVRVPARWLTPVRVAWWVLAVYPMLLFVVGVAPEFEQLRVACEPSACTNTRWFALTQQQARVLHNSGISLDLYAVAIIALEAAQALLYAGCGLLIFLRRSDEWIALLAALVLVANGVFIIPATPHSTYGQYSWMWSFQMLTYIWGHWLLPLLLFTLPDGRFVPRWSRWVLLLHCTVVTWLVLTGYLGMSEEVKESRDLIKVSVFVASSLVGVFGQVHRYRRVATPVMRQQIKWIAFGTAGFGLSIALGVILKPFPAVWGDMPVGSRLIALFVIRACMALFPVCLTLAVVRHHLWDIDIVVNRALVYGGLTAAIIGLYAIVVGGLGAILQAQDNTAIAIAGAGLVAVLFQPLHERVQRAANRLMYGQRDEPYTVLARFGRQLETTPALETLLPTIVAAIQATLKLRYVEISVTGGRPEVDSEHLRVSSENKAQGGLESPTIAFPLVYRGAAVGNIAVAPREGETELSPGDRRLLEDLARQAGVAVHAASVTVALQGARERLVTAREEERRRLRRDLHDGLGPTLAAIAAQTEAARDLIATRPELSSVLLSDVVAQAQTATGDIRRLAHNLRPPVLDDLGLAGAIRTQATRISQSNGLDVTVQADSLPALPAAVEVAAYFVVQEALTNVVRHAGARRCVIAVAVQDGDLTLEIGDDGRGLDSAAEPGVGLRSMRERTAELGGEVLLTTAAGGGTTVRARLPVARNPTHETLDNPTSAGPLIAPDSALPEIRGRLAPPTESRQ